MCSCVGNSPQTVIKNITPSTKSHGHPGELPRGRRDTAALMTWASSSLPLRPHGASASLVPQRTRRSRTEFCLATSPAVSSWLAGSLTPILISRPGLPHRLAVALPKAALRPCLLRPTSWTSECCCVVSIQLLGCGLASLCCCVLFTAAFLLK